MKVCISVLGRFHAFDLARELNRRGHLQSLTTSFPKYAAKEFEVPARSIRSLPAIEVLRRTWLRSPAFVKRVFDARPFIRDVYDRAAAKHIRSDCDIFVGWSGAALHSIKRAKQLGATTVLERGSCHIAVQDRILKEESELSDCAIPRPSPREIEQELLEYKAADFIAVPSAFARTSFLEQGFAAERILCIPFGVALDQFSPPKKPRDASLPFRVLHVGAVSHQKGCHYLLRAFRELALPNSELHFVGRVDESMHALLAREQAPNIFAHGTMPQAQLPSAYHRASVFCLASVQEGLSMVLAQAMACGLPVIASANTGAAEFIDHAIDGLIFEARNVEQLKQCLLKMHGQPAERAAIGERANTKIRSGFGWADYGDRIEATYKSLLSGNSIDPTNALPSSVVPEPHPALPTDCARGMARSAHDPIAARSEGSQT